MSQRSQISRITLSGCFSVLVIIVLIVLILIIVLIVLIFIIVNRMCDMFSAWGCYKDSNISNIEYLQLNVRVNCPSISPKLLS